MLYLLAKIPSASTEDKAEINLALPPVPLAAPPLDSRFKPAGDVCRAASGETGSEDQAELSQENFLHDDQAQITPRNQEHLPEYYY